MSSGSPTRKGVSQPPKGAMHSPENVAARKRARFQAYMSQFGPHMKGSAAYRRRNHAKGW